MVTSKLAAAPLIRDKDTRVIANTEELSREALASNYKLSEAKVL